METFSRLFRGTSRRKCPALGRTDAAGEILTYWCLSERKWPLDRADRSQRSPFYTTHKCKVSSQVLVCAFANRSQPTKIQNGLCTRMQRFIFFFPSSSTTTSKGSNLAIDRAVVIVCTTHHFLPHHEVVQANCSDGSFTVGPTKS